MSRIAPGTGRRRSILPQAGESSIKLITLQDEAATAALAARLARTAQPGDVLALRGPLGAGKTAFARGFIRALLGPDETVPSPTFTLLEIYETPGGAVWHLDLYRLTDEDEIWELGFEDALMDLAVLIEWPDRMGRHLPQRRVDLELAEGPAPCSRLARLVACGGSDWLDR